MITKAEAMTAHRFHRLGACARTVGPRGGVKQKTVEVRRTGQTKTWVTRPTEFQVPVKFGLSLSGYITHINADEWVVASQCPVCHPQGVPGQEAS